MPQVARAWDDGYLIDNFVQEQVEKMASPESCGLTQMFERSLNVRTERLADLGVSDLLSNHHSYLLLSEIMSSSKFSWKVDKAKLRDTALTAATKVLEVTANVLDTTPVPGASAAVKVVLDILNQKDVRACSSDGSAHFE